MEHIHHILLWNIFLMGSHTRDVPFTIHRSRKSESRKKEKSHATIKYNREFSMHSFVGYFSYFFFPFVHIVYIVFAWRRKGIIIILLSFIIENLLNTKSEREKKQKKVFKIIPKWKQNMQFISPNSCFHVIQ